MKIEPRRRWIDAAAGALESAEAAPSAVMTAAERRRLKVANKRVRELEKELRRKDKALAETAALLVLEKNSRALGWTTRTTARTRGTTSDSRSHRHRPVSGRNTRFSL